MRFGIDAAERGMPIEIDGDVPQGEDARGGQKQRRR